MCDTCRNLGVLWLFVHSVFSCHVSKSRVAFAVAFIASSYSNLDLMLIVFNDLSVHRKNKKNETKAQLWVFTFFSFSREVRLCYHGSKSVPPWEGRKDMLLVKAYFLFAFQEARRFFFLFEKHSSPWSKSLPPWDSTSVLLMESQLLFSMQIK